MTIYRVYLKHNEGDEEERTVAYTMFYDDCARIVDKYEDIIKYYEDRDCWGKGEISVESTEISVSERYLSKVLDDEVVDWQIRDFHQDLGRW